VEAVIAEESVIIGDGGDFVATASYIVRPRGPLSWLDPGAFGTLGAGGGFAIAAKLCRPTAEVWLLYGDGAAGFSLAEFDTMARHGIPVIGVIGNDASWAQIARDQVVYMGSSLATDLARTAYHQVAEGYGGVGFCVERRRSCCRRWKQRRSGARRPSRPRQHHDRQDGVPQRVDLHVKGAYPFPDTPLFTGKFRSAAAISRDLFSVCRHH
jgi:thiamine pyrophosphate-dependent acetolactate synthase large subunit-like protein